MLMKTRPYIDFSEVHPDHRAIHERLNNWRRWVRANSSRWTAHPMWRHLKEKEERERGATEAPPVNALDGHLIEKFVSDLPEKHRHAIRWAYVFQGNPLGAARAAAVSKERLAELIREGRTMLVNRLERLEKPDVM